MIKKIYVPVLCLALFTSCSQRLVTQGITNKTSNYVVTTEGKQINTSSLRLNGNAVSADSASYPLSGLSGIKIGPGYWGVQDGGLYQGVYYGKLMLLRRYDGEEIDMNTHMGHPKYSYYLQKQGQSEIDNFSMATLIYDVQDDPLALRKARTARIYKDVMYVSGITAIVGLSCVFLPYTSRIRSTAVTAGLFSMPVFLITLPIGAHKAYKSILIYNQ